MDLLPHLHIDNVKETQPVQRSNIDQLVAALSIPTTSTESAARKKKSKKNKNKKRRIIEDDSDEEEQSPPKKVKADKMAKKWTTSQVASQRKNKTWNYNAYIEICNLLPIRTAS